MCLKVNTHGDRSFAVSGQVGKKPAVFVWDTTTGKKVKRVKLNQNSRAVGAIAINDDGSQIATIDRSDDAMLTIFDVGSGSKVYEEKCKAEMQDMTFSHDGSNQVWACGKNKVWYFDPAKGKMKAGLFGSLERKSSSCICADDQGRAFSGATTGKIQIWEG
jgi:WD40 repeat protein